MSVERVAAAAVARRVAALARTIEAAVPGVAVSTAPGEIVVEGADLNARRMAEPVLRWPAGALR